MLHIDSEESETSQCSGNVVPERLQSWSPTRRFDPILLKAVEDEDNETVHDVRNKLVRGGAWD